MTHEEFAFSQEQLLKLFSLLKSMDFGKIGHTADAASMKFTDMTDNYQKEKYEYFVFIRNFAYFIDDSILQFYADEFSKFQLKS